MGVPVIATDHGPGREAVLAPPDVLSDAATGYHVPYDDPGAIAAALTDFLTLTPAARTAMGERGVMWVTDRFTLDRLTADTLALYRRLVR